MQSRRVAMVAAVVVPAMCAGLATPASARVVAAGRSAPALPVSSWSRAEVIPGQAIDVGGGDQVTSLSCGSPGNCAGAGFFNTANQHRQAMLVTETNGT